MAVANGDSLHGEVRSFRHLTRDRLLQEMLRTTKETNSKSIWKVLIMDKVTTKVMSYSCKMADITEEGISLVEDVSKRRQPLPAMEAVYFIQPSKENVKMFISDMAGKSPLYKRAFVFFSSPIPKELVNLIKRDTSILSRIGALREMNLEYFAIDSQGFSTDQERALEQLFGEHTENTRDYEDCLNTMACRLATVFASLKEFPLVRFRAARSAMDATTATTFRDLVPTKLAAALWNCLIKYKSSIPNYPQAETCDLLIVDRSIDQIAPVIHEWTYDAMCHDLLNMEGNKHVYEITTQTGKKERKEVLLDEHDPVWFELRDLHFAEASLKLHEKMSQFGSKNKAAQIRLGLRDGSELSTRDMQKMVQALPQYNDQLDKLSLHVDIAAKLNEKIKKQELSEIGHLEQDMVFGDAGTKELINILKTKEDITPENKLRLLMIYAAINPDKLAGEKGFQWKQLARLSSDDMNAVKNMSYLGASVSKKHSGGFSLKFGTNKKKHAVRKERNQEEDNWQLARFYPMVEELIESLSKGELSKDEYPCMNEPSTSSHSSPFHSSRMDAASVRSANSQAYSVRTSRPASTWARPRNSDDGYSSDSALRHATSDPKILGKRIFVFVIGGATRSELRVAHKLTQKLKREVVLGSSSVDDPHQFITKLKLLTVFEDLSLDDLDI
ncbi:SNARE-interacting protein KEULE isoform X1 [Cryptomeria japonica]|uniref:SNARE-interacting protein KEULE isoform X1 n=1 Tax=Cryptomeria japonica TaxID=3369 RepID=UPI0025ACB261|nr:SNARE-interacting protein KEULE isoform X1 [Cryptomeria japonica]